MRDAMPRAPLDFLRQTRQGPVDPIFDRRSEQFARYRERRLRFHRRTTGSRMSLDAGGTLAHERRAPVTHSVLAYPENLADRRTRPARQRKQDRASAVGFGPLRGKRQPLQDVALLSARYQWRFAGHDRASESPPEIESANFGVGQSAQVCLGHHDRDRAGRRIATPLSLVT